MILGKLSAILCGTVTGWLLFLPYRVLGEIVMAGVTEFGLGQKEIPEIVRWVAGLRDKLHRALIVSVRFIAHPY